MNVSIYILLAILSFSLADENANTKEMEQEEVKVDSEKLEYAKGSICGYCDYCKVCVFIRLI